MTKSTEEVKIKKENLLKTYREGCQDVKNTLKKIFPDVDFELNTEGILKGLGPDSPLY